jgi:hypothetical protein
MKILSTHHTVACPQSTKADAVLYAMPLGHKFKSFFFIKVDISKIYQHFSFFLHKKKLKAAQTYCFNRAISFINYP